MTKNGVEHMRLHKKTAAVLCAAIIACYALTGSAGASTAAPGSSGDPVVTKSYVDKKYSELYNQLNSQPPFVDGGLSAQERNDIVNAVLARLEGQIATATTPEPPPAFHPVYMLSGQVIIGGEGTEIILRSGAAMAYTEAQNGLADITAGLELFNNDVIYTNHLVIV
ncbi:MAG: hypothetical protein LBS19_11990, partial [Clostridiales bacterium]|nr:hypothetical protein [Clostridiales bacterium]